MYCLSDMFTVNEHCVSLKIKKKSSVVMPAVNTAQYNQQTHTNIE